MASPAAAGAATSGAKRSRGRPPKPEDEKKQARLWRCSVEPFTDADRDRLSSRAQGIDEAVTEVPQVPQTPFGLYHNPDDVRICVCYVLGVIAFAFSMAVHCTTSDCARGGDRSTPTG